MPAAQAQFYLGAEGGWTGLEGTKTSINGTTPGGHSFNIPINQSFDGVTATNGNAGLSGNNLNSPILDGVQEISYTTLNQSADEPFATTYAVSTKSGTSQFHGSGYWYLSNNSWNARNFFAATDDGLKRNQYGLAIGGPVIKNKTFFFFAWQGTQVRQRPPTSTTIVPTTEQRRGNFASLLPGTQLVDPTSKLPVPGNIIPTSQLDPIAQKVLETIPLPNQPNGLLYYTVASSTTDNQYIGRIDHQFGNNHRLSGRYFYDGLNNPAIIDGQNRLTNVADRFWDSQSFNLTDTITVSPTLLTNTTLSLQPNV
jgi:hypothetical protein